MSALSLRAIARALGGEVVGGQVIAPGPDHSRRDRSMTVRLSPTAPEGFLVYSHAGDDFAACRDYVRERLGLDRDAPRRAQEGRWQALPLDPPSHTPDLGKVAQALALWRGAGDPRGTLAERYLASRGLKLDDDLAGGVIRWNSRIGAMLALFRNCATGEPQAVTRIFVDANGRKLDRQFLGPVGGAAVMLDGFDDVTHGLHIGEGVETCLAGRQLGLRPVWALGSASAIAAFPVLAGIEALTLFAEHDDASARSVEACARRWHDAGREVLINRPIGGKDLNDAIRGAA